MPNALHLMSLAAKDAGISVSGTYKELQELQQEGKVVSAQVLPFFAKRMREAAAANGGLDKALQSNRVAMNRFMFAVQEAADIFFKSGFSEGLTEFFNSTAELLVDLQPLWKGFSKVAGNALSGISKVIKLLTPVLSLLGEVLTGLTNLLGDFSAALIFAFSPTVWFTAISGVKSLTAAFVGLQLSLKGTLIWAMRALFPLLAIIGAADELINAFGGSRKGLFLDNSVERQQRAGQLTKMGVPSYLQDVMPTGVAQTLNINTTLELDGEKVADAVAKTNSFDNAVDKKIGQVQ